MPRIKTDTVTSQTQPATWQQTIIDRIRAGKLVPIISNMVSDDLVLGGHDALVEAYAVYSRYPLEQKKDLAQMAQFKSITDDRITDALALKDDYVNFIKNRLFDLAATGGVGKAIQDEVEAQFDTLNCAQFCRQLGYPSFAQDHTHPFLLLAAFDLPIYITTGYHNFVEMALQQAGKTPRTEICRWHQDLEEIPSVLDGTYQPSKAEPLVYHLHGFDQYPDSLVLTEDDYLKFLVATSQNIGRETDPVHKRIRQAMSDSSLMLLGYSLRDWDLRSLFWGLIAPRTRPLTSAISIQLEPTEIEKLYLQKYLDSFDFKVYWGDIRAYMQELYQSLQG